MNLTDMDLMAATAGVSAVWMCGIGRVQTQLRGLALQSAAISWICVLVGMEEHASRYYLLAAAIFAVKTVGIPALLTWAANRVGANPDKGAYMGPAISMGLAGLVFFACFLAGRDLAVPSMHAAGSAGMAIALVFVGMLLMITRRLALGQIVGLLTMENGILLYSLTQTRGMPMIVEMGAVFEILVGVLVAGVIVFRLNRSFEHIDVSLLRRLQR